MTWLFNDPTDFAKEMTSGFASAHADLVRKVPGGVIRNTRSTPGTVSVVIGGGSGHYPAFAGLVGQGLAHGAAMGNLFASPSAQQICSVARAVHQGAGVLLAFGNYAGDLLHFSLARERLIAEGIPCEMIAVSDDISSAPAEEMTKRRGVAGTLAVFKTASAAAQRGDSLPQCLAVAHMANRQTRSIGVAFAGCTMPGAQQPLFTLPAGHMALGMGIHGEAGIHETPCPTAAQLADMLLEQLLKEVPFQEEKLAGARVVAILNGLGAVKYEELFVLWHTIHERLARYGVQIVDSLVGEFVTSFDMAGLSLTLFAVNEELESLWQAPAWTPAFKKGSIIQTQPLPATLNSQHEVISVPPASADSRQLAGTIALIIDKLTETLIRHTEELGRIDAVAGDGDHGIGMERGVRAAQQAAHQALQQGAGAATLLQRSADAWADKAGGTSGALWGVILNTLGTTLGDQQSADAACVALAVRQASDAVMHFGKAKVGDKTLVDVLQPFSEQLTQHVSQGLSLCAAWQAAVQVAQRCAEETAQLLPKIGRARPLAERSLGTADAGAMSLAIMLDTVGHCLKKYCR